MKMDNSMVMFEVKAPLTQGLLIEGGSYLCVIDAQAKRTFLELSVIVMCHFEW
jgi:hypothetical protein